MNCLGDGTHFWLTGSRTVPIGTPCVCGLKKWQEIPSWKELEQKDAQIARLDSQVSQLKDELLNEQVISRVRFREIKELVEAAKQAIQVFKYALPPLQSDLTIKKLEEALSKHVLAEGK